jgi:hypothetical protein
MKKPCHGLPVGWHGLAGLQSRPRSSRQDQQMRCGAYGILGHVDQTCTGFVVGPDLDG